MYSLRELESKIGQEFDKSEFEQAIDAGQNILDKLGQKWNKSQFLYKPDLQKIIGILEEQGEKTEIDELLKGKEEAAEDATTELESKMLSKMELDELVAEYEKAIGAKKEAIAQRIYQHTGKKDVKVFVERLKEIAREKTEVKVVGKEERIEKKIEERVAKVLPGDTPKEKVIEAAAEIKKVVLDEIPRDRDKIDGGKIRDEIRKVVGKDREIVEKLAARVEEIVAGEKVSDFASDLGERLARQFPDNPKIQKRIKEVIEARVKRVVYAEDANIFQTREVGGEVKTFIEEIGEGGETGGAVLKQADLEVESFLEKRVEVVDRARAGTMKERFGAAMTESFGGKEAINPEQKQAMEDFELMVDKIFYHRTGKPSLDIEQYRQVAEAWATRPEPEGGGIEPARAENSWHELRGVMGALRTKPKEFNKMVELYKKGNKILGDKLPNIPEIKVTEKIMAWAAKNPTFLNVLNLTQRFVSLTDSFNGIGGKILVKMGVEKAGWGLVERVGGQAGVTFVKEALTIIGKEGFNKGIMMILKGVLGGGVKAGGTAATGVGGGLAAASAAFLASNPVGWVIAVAALVIAAAVVVWKTVIAPVLNGIKNFLQKNLNIDLNRVKSFIAEDLGLGKFAGGVGQFFFDAGLFLVGLPALLATINLTAVIAPVFIFFMVGMLGYSLLQSSLVSSLVPPPIGGGSDGINYPGFEPWNPTIPVPEGCPSGRPTSGGFTQGPFAPGCTHQNMQVPAVDIGAPNTTPIVATHPGVAVLGSDSVYGFYIDIHGKCEGKDFVTRYAHMPQGGFRVANNSTVARGDLIGVVNNTGSSTGPHLHYHISGLDTNKFGQYLGLSIAQTIQLWGCCGSWNGKYCP